jgi:hypothetical protein
MKGITEIKAAYNKMLERKRGVTVGFLGSIMLKWFSKTG